MKDFRYIVIDYDAGWVVDEDGSSTWVEPEFFKLSLSEERNEKLVKLGL